VDHSIISGATASLRYCSVMSVIGSPDTNRPSKIEMQNEGLDILFCITKSKTTLKLLLRFASTSDRSSTSYTMFEKFWGTVLVCTSLWLRNFKQ